MEVIKWIGQHSNKVRSAIWQAILLSVAFRWITIEEAQLAVLGMFLDALLGLFVETNTVSKVRVGERINEGVEKVISSGTGTGTDPSSSQKIPSILLALALGGTMLAGCAQGMHGAARAEDVAHDGLMAFDRMLDARCDAGELTAPTCKELNSLLVPVWDIKNNLNRTIAGGTSAVPARLDQFQTAIKALIAKVNDLVQGGAKELLLRELNLSIQQTQ